MSNPPIILTVSCVPSSPDARYAAHASWYGHAPGYEHDARGSASTWHPHGHGAPGYVPSWHVSGRSAEDGPAPSGHGAAAGGESQAAGEVLFPLNTILRCDQL